MQQQAGGLSSLSGLLHLKAEPWTMPWMGVQCHFCLGLDLNLAERGQPDWLLDERVQLAGRQAAAASEGGTLELAARLLPKV